MSEDSLDVVVEDLHELQFSEQTDGDDRKEMRMNILRLRQELKNLSSSQKKQRKVLLEQISAIETLMQRQTVTTSSSSVCDFMMVLIIL